VLSRDNHQGQFIYAWRAVLKRENFETPDASANIAYVMTVKEVPQILIIKKAFFVSVDVYNKYLKDQIMEIIDIDKKLKMQRLRKGWSLHNRQKACDRDGHQPVGYVLTCYHGDW
jgi:nucleosome binding factor SPN SPT16 subunit